MNDINQLIEYNKERNNIRINVYNSQNCRIKKMNNGRLNCYIAQIKKDNIDSIDQTKADCLIILEKEKLFRETLKKIKNIL